MAHPLLGADLGTLWRAFRQGGRPDDFLRVAGICAGALGRAPFSLAEKILAARMVPPKHRLPAPIFIVGHWRSGTTHLYNLMATDGFGYVSPIMAGLPWDVLGLGRILGPALRGALPKTRWIDQMPVTPSSPQEDELALASMSPLSFYHGLYFPRRFSSLIAKGLFLDGATKTEIERWEQRLISFYRRVSHAQGSTERRPLLIKNPVYTGRISQLRRIFPEARFIHIHRDPMDVFLSMRNFHRKLLEVMALQKVPDDLDVDAVIFSSYDRMMEAFVQDVADLPSGSLVELDYQTLVQEPLTALQQIYVGLGIDGYQQAVRGIRIHLADVQDYAVNRFTPDCATADMVAANWGRWIAYFGYPDPRDRLKAGHC